MPKAIAVLSKGKGFAAKLSGKLGIKKLPLKLDVFPDGELYVRFLGSVKGKTIYMVQSLSGAPNNALLELFLAARTAKELGAKKVFGILPYLGYMRQDKRFKAGECFSAKEVAWLLSNCLDRLYTFDAHLHRIKSLNKIFRIPAKNLSSAKPIAAYIKKKFSSKNTVIVGPDIESSQWAAKIAKSIGFESTILRKKRFHSRKVKVHVHKELEWKGKNVVIVDDIVSSGHTMAEAIKAVKKRGVKEVHCICIHAVFSEDALRKIRKAGAKSIASCNTIPHATNKIDVSGEMVNEL